MVVAVGDGTVLVATVEVSSGEDEVADEVFVSVGLAVPGKLGKEVTVGLGDGEGVDGATDSSHNSSMQGSSVTALVSRRPIGIFNIKNSGARHGYYVFLGRQE